MTSSPRYDDVIAGEFDHRPGGFPASVSDDVIMAAGHKDAPEHLLSLNIHDVSSSSSSSSSGGCIC